jgi:hypothetical protein
VFVIVDKIISSLPKRSLVDSRILALEGRVRESHGAIEWFGSEIALRAAPVIQRFYLGLQ